MYLSLKCRIHITLFLNGIMPCQKNCWREEDSQCLTNLQPYTSLSATLSNANMIAPSHNGLLPLPTILSQEDNDAIVLPALRSSSLILLGQIYDNKCTMIFDKNKLVSLKDNKGFFITTTIKMSYYNGAENCRIDYGIFSLRKM